MNIFIKIAINIVVFLIGYFWTAFWFMASSSIWFKMTIDSGFTKGLYFSSLVVAIWFVICGIIAMGYCIFN